MRTKTENGHDVDLGKLIEGLREVVRDSQQLLKAGIGTARSRVVAGAKETDRLARAYPYHTLGMAFGIGLLAGLLACNLFRSGGESSEEDFD